MESTFSTFSLILYAIVLENFNGCFLSYLKIFVAESGIQNRADVERLYQAGINAVLIGETFMKAKNKKELMQQFHFGINDNQ